MKKLLLAALTLSLLLSACGSENAQDGGKFNIREDAGIGADDTGHPLPDTDGADTAPEADALPTGAALGAACDQDADCIDGRCLPHPDHPGGYCTTPEACRLDNDCTPASSACYTNPDGAYCAQQCLVASDCRDGYACVDSPASPRRVCVPYVEPEGVADGEPCQADADCKGGTCLDHPRWPGGYCTTMDCGTREDCAREGFDNRCLVGGQGYNICVRMCSSAADCREGYVCQDVGGGEGFCAPDRSEQLGMDSLDDYPFDITCGVSPGADGETVFDFDVDPSSSSYMVTPLAKDGSRLTPLRIDAPSGQTINFSGENDFQAVGSMLFGYLNPTIVPAIGDFAGQMETGAHSYAVSTSSTDLCYYVLEESTPGTTIDFNIYLVGTPMDSTEAPTDERMQTVLDQFRNIYGQWGIQLGEVTYTDITGDYADAYEVLRSERDIQELVALSEKPAGGYDEVLSANIFFVRSIQLGGAIGISEGLPGAAGLHGTASSGVVFTSEYMGQRFQDRSGSVVDGDEFTGIVLAHEVGHYLGLFHTSEQYGQGFDPLDDTPRCTDGFPDSCPDLDNLMFPLAGISHTQVTDDQKWVVEVNPLTKD